MSTKGFNAMLLGHGLWDFSIPPSSPLLPAPQAPPPPRPCLEPGLAERREEKGLFDAMLGDPTVLFDELLRNPSTYAPGVDVLLQEMIQTT